MTRQSDFSVPTFFTAFQRAPRPGAHELTPHRCAECDRVRDDFSRYPVDAVPDEVLAYHGDSIPLLSPKAYRYFLPAYVKFSDEQPDSNAADGLLFNLSPDDPHSDFWAGRCDAFTAEERDSIVAYLQHRRASPDGDVEDEWIAPALLFWTH